MTTADKHFILFELQFVFEGDLLLVVGLVTVFLLVRVTVFISIYKVSNKFSSPLTSIYIMYIFYLSSTTTLAKMFFMSLGISFI